MFGRVASHGVSLLPVSDTEELSVLCAVTVMRYVSARINNLHMRTRYQVLEIRSLGSGPPRSVRVLIMHRRQTFKNGEGLGLSIT